MKTQDILILVAMVVLIAFSAVFSGMDMSYSTVKLNRLEEDSLKGNVRAKRALKLAKNYDSAIANILFGNDFVNLLASSLSSILAKDLLEPAIGNSASTVMSVILLFVLLMFGEITPKAIAKNHAYRFALLSSGLLQIMEYVLFPIVYPINKLLSRLTSKAKDISKGGESEIASDDELSAMVDQIQSEGIIDNDQSELLKKSIDFKETNCYEVMTPRVMIFGYDITTLFSDFLKKKDCFLHSRIIVYQHDLDHIVGYVQAKTLLKILVQNRPVDINKITFPINAVPRTMMISSAMKIMKQSKHHILVVKDEYGGTDGILTMEDILEELVGELWDEDEDPEQFIVPLKQEGTYMVRGNTNIDDFMETFGIDPDQLESEYTTLSGFITHQLERFPKVGDAISYKHLDIQVLRVNGELVDMALVNVKPNLTEEKKPFLLRLESIRHHNEEKGGDEDD